MGARLGGPEYPPIIQVRILSSIGGEGGNLIGMANSPVSSDAQRPTGDGIISVFRALVENIDLSYFKALADYSRILYISPGAERLWGHDAAEVYRDPWRWVDWIHPDDREATRQFFADNWTRDVYENESRIVRSDGEVRWLSLKAFRQTDPDGTPTVVGYHQDITERKRLEHRLQAQRDLNRRYLDTAEAIIVSLDTAGRIALINRKGANQLGYEPAELIGQSWFERCLPQPEGINVIYPVFRKVLEGEAVSVEYFENEVVTRSGERRLIAWHNSAFFDEAGVLAGTLSTGHDVTDRRQAAESTALASMIVNTVREVVWVVSPDWRQVHFISPSYEAVWGRSAARLKIDGRDWLAAVDAAYQPALLDVIAATDTNTCRNGLLFPDFPIARPDGSERWIAARAYPVRDEAGALLRYVGVAEDVTDQKRMAQAVAESERKYRGLVETAQELVWKVDREGRATYLNPAWEKALGYRIDEMIGRRYIDFLPESLQHDELQRFNRLLSQGGFVREYEAVYCARDGRLLTLLFNAVLEFGRDGELVGAQGTAVDITERKHAEARIRASERRFRDLVNASDGIVWEAEATDFRFTFVSDKAERLLGFPVSDWLLPDFWVTRLHPDDRQWAPAFCAANTSLLEPHSFEYRFIARDGHIVWLRDMVTVVAEGGRPRWLRGIMVDITEHKLAEARLKESERRFRDLVNTTEGIVWEAAAEDFRFTFLSDKAERLLGIPLSVLMRPGGWLAHVHPNDRGDIAAFLIDGLRRGPGEPVACTYRFLTPDGRVVWLRDVMTVVSDPGQPPCLRGIIVDITELKQSQQGLELAQQVFDTAGEAIFVSDLAGNLLEVNPEACRLAKYSREEMLRLRNVDIVVAEEVPRIANELGMADRGEVVENRWLLLCSDKTTVPLDLVVQRLPGDRYLAIGRDLTERERAMREVARARDEAQAANIAKSRFLAAASHDLRQPIQAINLLCDAMSRTGLNSAQARIAEGLTHSVRSLGDLLNALLDISKLDSGMLTPQAEKLSSGAIFSRLDAEFAPLAASRNLRFLLHFPFDEFGFEVDGKLLHTLLANLIGNAIKYTNSGGVLVALRRREEFGLFQIWDTGIGIGEDHLPRIYDEYYQIGNLQRDRAKGLGLGLAIVRRIARLLGTEVTCRSQPGRGSVFEFRLPLIPLGDLPAPAVLSNDASGSVHQLSGKTLAVIEDDPMVGRALSVTLASMGCAVLEHSSGEAALADAAVLAADYVLSDLRLPGINGVELLNALQARSPVPLRAILLTGDTEPGRIDMVRRSGWPMLFKPVNLPALVAALADLDRQ